MMWRQQRIETLGPASRWLSSDSSPVADFDWLWAFYFEVADELLPQTLEAVCKLESMMVSRLASKQLMDIDPLESPSRQDEWEVSEEQGKLLDIIRANFDEHVCSPASLASGFLVSHTGALHWRTCLGLTCLKMCL